MAPGRRSAAHGYGVRRPAGSPPAAAVVSAVVVALLVMPAGGAVGQPPIPPDPVDPSITDGTAQRKLDSARQRWRTAGFRSYRYLVRRGCFCLPPPRYRRIVVVRGRPSRQTARDVRDVATVPRLFRKVERAIKARVAELVVTYGRYGVPRRIFVDRIRLLADEEVDYSVRRFRPGRR